MEDKQIKTEYSIQQESSTYQTGSTKPPKDRGGLVAVLLTILLHLTNSVGPVTTPPMMRMEIMHGLRVSMVGCLT